MPNSRSARKRMRQADKHRDANRQQRSTLRTAVKKVRSAETPEARAEALKAAESALDRAAGKRLIHPNAASRTKSRLHKAAKPAS